MHLKPILSALMRHKVIVTLLVLVTALSCAVVSNSVFLMNLRLQRLGMPAGYDENRLVEIVTDNVTDPHTEEAKARTRETLAMLRQVPGVAAATFSNMAPYDWNAAMGGYMAANAQDEAAKTGPIGATYAGEDLAQTLGLQLLSGRWLDPTGFVDDVDASKQGSTVAPKEALITQALAQRVWPGQDPLGKLLYYRGGRPPVTVVGVVAHLPRSVISTDGGGDYSIVLPMRMTVGQYGYFLLRTSPAQRNQVMQAAIATLRKLDPHTAVTIARPLIDARHEQLSKDKSMASVLAALCVTLLLVTGLGIVGLSSYWVQQRRRQIGVRRALGATRSDILRHFMAENFLLTSLGVALGMALAYGLSMLLMHYYELPRLPLFYFPVGALAMWLTGQFAVLAPALRASSISPMTAAAG